MSLGSRINEIRREKKISIDELCERSGVPKGTLSKITAGITSSPTLDTVRAIADALECRLDDFDDSPKRSDILSPDEQSHIKKYRLLDEHGKEAVNAILDVEHRRCKDNPQIIKEAVPLEHTKTIPVYCSPAAAGFASPILGEEYDNYALQPEDPQGAMFSVRVGGDSMEPYFPDGSIAFCNKDPIRNGDIGVFCVDGGAVIKQYYKDPFGIVYLFSLNRERSDADVVISASSNRGFNCLGKVITKKRFPIPGKEYE